MFNCLRPLPAFPGFAKHPDASVSAVPRALLHESWGLSQQVGPRGWILTRHAPYPAWTMPSAAEEYVMGKWPNWGGGNERRGDVY